MDGLSSGSTTSALLPAVVAEYASRSAFRSAVNAIATPAHARPLLSLPLSREKARPELRAPHMHTTTRTGAKGVAANPDVEARVLGHGKQAGQRRLRGGVQALCGHQSVPVHEATRRKVFTMNTAVYVRAHRADHSSRHDGRAADRLHKQCRTPHCNCGVAVPPQRAA